MLPAVTTEVKQGDKLTLNNNGILPNVCPIWHRALDDTRDLQGAFSILVNELSNGNV
ncbi:hypothetical protein [Methylobacterium sp. MA0201]|jgi:hypothetical protein|uniref:hypothetical protein n=1 Tax=Methylobacterium alsaeris TaxID=3344826 RepID=UPI0037584923